MSVVAFSRQPLAPAYVAELVLAPPAGREPPPSGRRSDGSDV